MIDEAESAKDEAERKKQEHLDDEKQEVCKADERKCKVVAVTGCPTGIAHTYMAAEALEKAGAKLGIEIKVENRGSGGAKMC